MIEQRIRYDNNEAIVNELLSYRRLKSEIAELEAKAEDYRSNYGYIKATQYDKVSVKGGEVKNVLADIAIKWADMTADIERKKLKAEHLLWSIEAKIENLNPDEKQIIRLYYIKGYSIHRIALTLHFDESTIKRKKKKALKNYAKAVA